MTLKRCPNNNRTKNSGVSLKKRQRKQAKKNRQQSRGGQRAAKLDRIEQEVLTLGRNLSKMNTSSSSSNGLRSHPVVRAICNYLDPRSATKSTVHGLDDAKPSQKYTLYARSSISVPQGSVMIGAFMPTVFSGSTTPDLFVGFYQQVAFQLSLVPILVH